MKLILVGILLALVSMAANAQAAQQCICTNPVGCNIASGPFAPPPAEQPTACTLKNMSGGTIGSAPPVDAATIPTSNATSCSPADVTYVPGPVGSKACLVFAGNAYTVGNTLTFTMTATYASSGESAASLPLSFVNVVALPVPAVKPFGLRHAIWVTPDGEPVLNMAGAWVDG